MIAPSRGRMLLAIFVDYLLLTALLEPLLWLLRREGLPWSGWYVSLGLFALVEAALLGLLRRTPGTVALGIIERAGARVVEPSLRTRERWWTMLVGVLGLMEGAKETVRFTQGLPPPPFMGLALTWDQGAAIVTVSGLLYMTAGLGVLRARTGAALLGMLLSTVTLVSWLASWDETAAWVEARTVARRAMQGIAVREGELATMRWVLPFGAMFGSVVGGSWLFAVFRRFRRVDRLS